MRIALVGTVGVPGRYGGFETLAENLVRHHADTKRKQGLEVYCSAKAYPDRAFRYLGAELHYIPLDANGVQSIPYDIWAMVDAARRGTDVILLLGVSGALMLPLLRLLSRVRIVTNIDGIEWKRDKWSKLARAVLRASEWAAVRFSHVVIADNQAIADYVTQRYHTNCAVIPYGGDHALNAEPDPSKVADLPENYALALCRIEPENNVHMILEAWSKVETPLVFVGNWDMSTYGRDLKARYKDFPQIHILDPVYDPSALRAVRDRARLYVHGHSAGGTNPSLVEMMHFAIPVVAYECTFNRYTTDNRALYFRTASDLVDAVARLDDIRSAGVGKAMGEIARARYTWTQIGNDYFQLFET